MFDYSQNFISGQQSELSSEMVFSRKLKVKNAKLKINILLLILKLIFNIHHF